MRGWGREIHGNQERTGRKTETYRETGEAEHCTDKEGDDLPFLAHGLQETESVETK